MFDLQSLAYDDGAPMTRVERRTKRILENIPNKLARKVMANEIARDLKRGDCQQGKAKP